MIPDFGDLKPRFVELIESSSEFSPAERREAVLRMFSPQGYEWSLLCPAYPAKRGLLIPAPWSNTPLILSGRFAELVIWESEPRRAELLGRFYGDLRLPTRVINGPLDRLANHAERYGVVAFEDSFAQLAGRVPDDVLIWAARLLEPDGQCCVVTANRLGHSTFRGRVPSMENVVRKQFRDSNPLPSPGGLRRKLRHASLGAQRTYLLYPNHGQPREILGWRGSLPRHLRGPLFRLLDRLGMIAPLHDGFMVIAGQNPPISGFVEQLLMRLGDELSLNAVPFVHECRVQKTGVLLFFLSLDYLGEAVLRLPLHHRGALRMAASRHVLALLAERAPQIYSLAPEQLAAGVMGGTPYTLERRLPGVPAARFLSRADSGRHILQEALLFLDHLSRVQRQQEYIDDRFIADNFEPAISTLRRHFPDLSNELAEVQAYLVRSTHGQQLPLIWVHGDFNTRNVLFEARGTRLSGVIDWDLGGELDLPLQDLLHFILSAHRLRHGWCIGKVVVRALEGGLLSADERAALLHYRELLDLPEALVPPLLIFYWVRHIAGHSEDAATPPGSRWTEENFIEPLRSIRCLIK